MLNCYEDNQAFLAIIARGFSPKLRHLSKFHKINVASTCEAISKPGINAEYIEALKQRADVLTKSLSVSAWDSTQASSHSVAQDLKLFLLSEFCIPYAFRVPVFTTDGIKT